MPATLLESLSCCCARPDDGHELKIVKTPTGGCEVLGEDQRQRHLRWESRDSKGSLKFPSPQASTFTPIDAKEEAGLRETVRLAQRKLKSGRLTDWQKEFCYPESVARYYRGRNNNPEAASDILAQALEWREEYREVLRLERTPKWQTDLRVLSRGEDGVPIIYGCFRYNKPATGETTTHIIEHMAAVMEAANRARRKGVMWADNIMDCHGYRMTDNLNPAPMMALMRMASQPYRDGLRLAIVVDAPGSFSFLWKAAKPFLPEKTRNKVQFVSMNEAIELIEQNSGSRAAGEVAHVMKLNRTKEGFPTNQWKFPSQVPEDDIDRQRHAQKLNTSLVRQLSRTLSRTLSNFSSAFGGTTAASKDREEDTSRAPEVSSNNKPSMFGCCRRRRVENVAGEGRKLHVN